jgi:hypothetical protein
VRVAAVAVVAVVIALVGIAACGPRAAPADPDRSAATSAFARRLVAAVAARDPGAAAELYADAASIEVIGIAGEIRGRAAIEAAFRDGLERHPEARLALGRTWIGPSASVIELVAVGSRRAGTLAGADAPAGPVGVRAAVVVLLDDTGRVATQRLYVDVLTLVGQLDPQRLPPGVAALPRATEPPAGTGVAIANGTAGEAANAAVSERVWTAMEAGRAADALAPMADDYVYDDLVAPAPLDRAGTERLVAGFLALVPDFRIADRPVIIAAGDDVVTEIVEHGTLRGRPIVLHALDIRRIVDGRIVREWQYSNQLELVAVLTAP